MKASHLTLRLTAALSKALDRLAHSRGVPKSQLVREAVANYLAPVPEAETVRVLTASELSRHWGSIRHLDRDQANDLGSDIAKARSALPAALSRWK